MKSPIKIIITAFLLLIHVYLLMVFAELDFNPLNWCEQARLLGVLIYISGVAVVYALRK